MAKFYCIVSMVLFAVVSPAKAQGIYKDSLEANRLTERARQITPVYPDSALLMYEKALVIYRILDMKTSMIQTYYRLGNLYNLRGEYQKQVEINQKGLVLAKEFNDSTHLMRFYNNLGDGYMNQHNYEMAYEYLDRTMMIAEKQRDHAVMGVVRFNMGFVLKGLRRYNEAREQLENSLEISENIGDKAGVAFSLNEMGHLDYLEGYHGDALEQLQRANKLVDSLNITSLKADNLIKLSRIYTHNGELGTAINMLFEAVDLALKFNNSSQQASALNEMARVYMKQENYNLARRSLERSMQISKSIKNAFDTSESYLIYSQMEETRGNTFKSLQFLKRHNTLNDSIDDVLMNTRVSNLRQQNEIDKRNFEISMLNLREEQRIDELKTQKTYTIVLSALLFALVVLLVMVLREGVKRRRTSLLLEQHRKELMTKNSELDELVIMKDKFISILAHDLRSPIRTLASIIELAVSKQMTEEELDEILGEIKMRMEYTSNLLDNLLEWVLLQMGKITVNKVNFDIRDVVEENLKVISQMSEKNIEFVNKVESFPVKADKNMVDLALRNLLANSLKFTKEGKVTVSLKANGEEAVLSVRDTGVGLSKEDIEIIFEENNLVSKKGTSLEKGTGLGLKITKEFVERNGGRIWAENAPDKGSIFSFTLPVK